MYPAATMLAIVVVNVLVKWNTSQSVVESHIFEPNAHAFAVQTVDRLNWPLKSLSAVQNERLLLFQSY